MGKMMDDARLAEIYRRVGRQIAAGALTGANRFNLPAEVWPLAAAMLAELRCHAPGTIVMDVEVRGNARIWVRAILPGRLVERAVAEQIIDDYQSLPAGYAMDIVEEWCLRG